jgi:hypothetical protein
MATNPEHLAFSARSSDVADATRDELLAIASLAGGVVVAAGDAIRSSQLTELDAYALEQAERYFRGLAETQREGLSAANMAAMGAVREIQWTTTASLQDRVEAAKFFESLAVKIARLRKAPKEKKVAEELRDFFKGISIRARGVARGLVYDAVREETAV